MNYPTTTAGLRRHMRNCAQTEGMSVLAHGLQVARYFEDLRSHVLHKKPMVYQWQLPDWAYSEVLWTTLPSLPQMRRYHIYHDCGKPWSQIVDADGKVHFPEHAEKSALIWRSLLQDEDESVLMQMDMHIHLLKDAGVASFALHPFASALLLTALAEIHANASMFGGIESLSFKMKYKQINRRGRAIVRLLENQR